MKERNFWIAASVVMFDLVGMTEAHAASGERSTTAGHSAANVIAPLVLRHVNGRALNFGKFSVGTGGTVVVSPTGAGSVTKTVYFVPGSVTAADQFQVTGDKLRNFSIVTYSGSVKYLTKTINFTTKPSASQGLLDATGKSTFTVGGTLTLIGTETAGAYKGTYRATVTYD